MIIIINILNISVGSQIMKYIKSRSDQLRIVKSCHVDATSGHFGVKKTVARIKERFMWKGVWKDAKDMVYISIKCNSLLALLYLYM